MNLKDKIVELGKIAQEIQNFKELEIAKLATNSVPGEGNPDSEVIFIGEAPGAQEDLSGRPFVGVSGQMLAKTLEEILGLKRDQIYITNIVKYRPPDNRDPSPDEIEACKGWLDRQIAIISPKIIVTLGRFSMSKFIPGVTISKVHGQVQEVGQYLIFPMYHPAAALRAGHMMKEFKLDFLKLKSILEEIQVTNSQQKLNQKTSLL